MSHGSGEEENYWPGYVDALTSMVQVLAFVMMLLAMAVFVLSQNVSKSAVESIAKAAKLNPPADATVSQLTAMVIEALEKAQAQKPTPPAPDSPSAPDSTPKPEDLAAAAAAPPSGAAPTPMAAPKPGPTAAPTTMPEPVHTPEHAQASIDSTQAPTPTGKRELPSKAVSDTDVPPDAKSVVLHFDAHGFAVDPGGLKDIEKLLSDAQSIEKGGQITLRAYASSVDGALSEARHLAYYRAMSVRTQLISHKVLAAKIKIKVIDVSDKARGSTVDLFSE